MLLKGTHDECAYVYKVYLWDYVASFTVINFLESTIHLDIKYIRLWWSIHLQFCSVFMLHQGEIIPDNIVIFLLTNIALNFQMIYVDLSGGFRRLHLKNCSLSLTAVSLIMSVISERRSCLQNINTIYSMHLIPRPYTLPITSFIIEDVFKL